MTPRPPEAETATRIQVVYPRPNHVIYEDHTFLMGAVQGAPAGSRLLINRQDVPLSGHGFFAWQVPVKPGQNPLQLKVLPPDSSGPAIAEELLSLYGEPPLAVLPISPLAIHEETLTPRQDVWLSEEDVLTVAVSASVDAEVRVAFPGMQAGPIPWQPLNPNPELGREFLDNREPIFAQLHQTKPRIPVKGYYWARIPAAELYRIAGPIENAPMVLQLRHGDQVLEKPLAARLTLLAKPRLAILSEDRVITRTAPESGARLTPQRAGAWVAVDGLNEGWARARLNRDEVFYVPLEALAFLSDRLPPEPAMLDVIQVTPVEPNGADLRLVFSSTGPGACPVQVESVPADGLNRLQIRLYGVRSRCDFIHYPPQSEVVRQVHWRQVAESTLELWIDLQRPLAGYDYYLQDGAWHFTVKTLPARMQDTRILLDPGHGGDEPGAIGLNGLPEKDLNLTVSRLVRDALATEGFQVNMSREADVMLPLEARSKRAREIQADIVLSLHHNALPDGRDPLAAEGACTFYYHAFSKPLAETILQGLTAPADMRFTVSNYGLLYDSLHMTRIHQALAVLVEVGFFTNPTEFERLIDPEFQQEAADRIAQSVKAYCLQAQKTG
jgi:N-acetylmuramoyl-L-alanine amidase